MAELTEQVFRESGDDRPRPKLVDSVPASDGEPQRSMGLSIRDGFSYSLMVGFGENYFAAFAVFLGANNFQLGVLTSLPPLVAGLTQFFSLQVLEKFKSRKKMVCAFAFLQGCMLIPLFFSYKIEALRFEAYILLVILYTAAGMFIGPIWNSWIGDIVPSSKRGVYFGKRNRAITIGTFLSMLVAGFILRSYKEMNLELTGFLSIFTLALLARVWSTYFLSKKMEPSYSLVPTHFGDFLVFFKSILTRNEGRLILYMAAINFAVYMAAAYFTPYLLRTLNFSYMTYTLIVGGIALTKFFTSSFWGEICDRMGERKVIYVTGLLVPLSTVPWAFTGSAFWLFAAQCFSGFLWAGYELATFTFLLNAVSPSERARVVGYSSIIVSAAAFLGGLVGSLIVLYGPVLLHPFALVFLVSAILRLIAMLVFVPQIKEVRTLHAVKTSEVLIQAMGFKSAVGFTRALFVDMWNKKKK